jgi:hypothetical protein
MKRIFSVLIAAALVLAACNNPFGGEEDSYGIAISVDGAGAINPATGYIFPPADVGYTSAPSKTITVTNTGNQATGVLTIGLSGTNMDSFTLTPPNGVIPSIPAGGTGTVTLGPNNGLAVETYTAFVTVTGGNGIGVIFPVNFTVRAAYGISVSKTGTYPFPSVVLNNSGTYPAQTPLEVTVTNTGSQATGALTVGLSGANMDSFTLSAASLDSIGTGVGDKTAAFTVAPNGGLAAGTYTAVVTVSGGSGGNSFSESFNLSFTVLPYGTEPVYNIGLFLDEADITGLDLSGTTPEVTVGYEAIEPATVTIRNTGNVPTGALTVTLSGTGAGGFALNGNPVASVTVESIPEDGTATFTVGPRTGLAAGTYPATITVSNSGNDISAYFSGSFTVQPQQTEPSYGITISVDGTGAINPATGCTFPAANAGYTATPLLTIAITNTGNQPTGQLTVGLSGTGAGSFALTPANGGITSIPVDGTATFTLGPKTGLTAGTYTANVAVSGGHDIFVAFPVRFTVRPIGPEPGYGIALFLGAEDITGQDMGNMASLPVNYPAITPMPITIANTGDQPTGTLTVTLTGTGFALNGGSAASVTVESIPVGGTGSFTAGPKYALAIGTYSATITVTGSNGISASFSGSITVTDGSGVPDYEYEIECVNLEKVDNTYTYTFPAANEGYGPIDPITVIIKNTGSKAVGPLAILNGPDFFTLSTTTIDTLEPGETGTFTVGPRTGLSAYDNYLSGLGVYTGEVIISARDDSGDPGDPGGDPGEYDTGEYDTGGVGSGAGPTTLDGAGSGVTIFGSGILMSPLYIKLSFTVTDYNIELDRTGTLAFLGAQGYTAIPSRTVTITNTGNVPTGPLSVTLSGTNAGYFTLSENSLESIEGAEDRWTPGGTASFTVGPAQTGLAIGTYTAAVTVSGGNGITASVDLSFKVYDPAGYLTSIEAVEESLGSAQGGSTADAPVSLKAALGAGDWEALLQAIEAAEKYVALDLSASAVIGIDTAFDPGKYNTGEPYIVSLVLPEEAESINVTDYSQELFRNFTSLREVSGVGIKNFGYGEAFKGCTSLVSASFPAATVIDFDTFSGCTSLAEIDFPNVEVIGGGAFYGCTGLITASFPKTTIVYDDAFSGCTGLTEVSLPWLESVQSNGFLFNGCPNLTTINIDPANTHYTVRDGMVLSKDGTELVAYPSAKGAITVPGITSIGWAAFKDCSGLTSASFPDATSIDHSAFWNSGLISADFPEVTNIDVYAFNECRSLASVNIPKVSSISGTQAFGHTGNTALTITMGDTPPTVGSNVFEGAWGTTVTVRVPSGAMTSYDETWVEAFKGLGTAGYGYVNSYITVVIEPIGGTTYQ